MSMRAPDLVHRLQHSRANTAALLRQLGECGGRCGGQGDAHPHPDDGHPRGHENAARARIRGGSGQQADGEQCETGRDGNLGAHQVDDPVGGNCPDHQDRDQRQKPQARDDGISAENALEVLRHGEQDADHGEDRHRREQHAPSERGGAEQREVDQRLTAGPGAESAFPAEESDQQRHSADHHEHGAGIAPASWPALIRP
jgi:hypothetical protein